MNYTVLYQAIFKELGDRCTYDPKMAARVELWRKMYEGKAPWNGERILSAGVASGVAAEVAKLMTIEARTTLEGSKLLELQLTKKVMPHIRTFSEYGLAKGSLIIKPIVSSDGMNTQFIQADKFFPISYDSNKDITSCVLVDQVRKGKYIYTRFEIHTINGNLLTVENTAYKSSDDGLLGTRCSLSDVEQWENLDEETSFTGIDKLPFGLFRCPLANRFGDSPLGSSVFSRAVEHIKEADKRYSDICWEYEAKQAAVHVAESMLKYDKANDRFIMPDGTDRLYRAMQYNNGATDKPFIDVYSPEIRSSAYFDGFNAQLRMIEFDCSLAYGTISDPNTVDKTATEIEASKQRSYTLISDCQAAMETALQDWSNGALFWARLYGLENSSTVDLKFDWGDSILSNPQAEREEDRKDVSMGIMRPEEYRAKWYGEDEKTALSRLPASAEVLE